MYVHLSVACRHPGQLCKLHQNRISGTRCRVLRICNKMRRMGPISVSISTRHGRISERLLYVKDSVQVDKMVILHSGICLVSFQQFLFAATFSSLYHLSACNQKVRLSQKIRGRRRNLAFNSRHICTHVRLLLKEESWSHFLCYQGFIRSGSKLAQPSMSTSMSIV